MSSNKFCNLCAKHSSYTVILYVIGLGLICVLTDVDEMFGLVKLRVLNRLMPTLQYTFLNDVKDQEQSTWEDYAYYYQKVSDYVPGLAGAHAVLGYSEYRLGRMDRSRKAYEESIELNGHFFWSYYNLGLLEYKQGNYKRAIQLFDKALGTKMEVNFKIIYSSKVYQQILLTSGTTQQQVLSNLEQGFKDAGILKLRSLHKLGEYEQLLLLSKKMSELRWSKKGEAQFYMAVALFKLGQIEQAAKMFQQTLKINPKSSECYEYLSKILSQSGKSQLAQVMNHKAKQLKKEGHLFMSNIFELRVL